MRAQRSTSAQISVGVLVGAIIIIILLAGLATYFGVIASRGPQLVTVQQTMTTTETVGSIASGLSYNNSAQIIMKSTALQSGNPSYFVFSLDNTGANSTGISAVSIDNYTVNSLSGNSKACPNSAIPTASNCVPGNDTSTFSVIVTFAINLGSTYSYTVWLENGQVLQGTTKGA